MISLSCSQIPEPQKKPQASGDTCGGEETTSPGSQRGERVELFQEPKVPILKPRIEFESD